MSSVHSQHSTQHPPETRPPTFEDKGHGEAEMNYQPKSFRFWAIIIGVYLSLFLVELVSFVGKAIRQLCAQNDGLDRIE